MQPAGSRLRTLGRRWVAIPLLTRWVVVFWAALVGGVFGRVLASKPTANSVVPIYLSGGEHWLNAERIYGPTAAGMDAFCNPPGVAALFTPLTFLPPKVAALLWRALGVALYAWGLARVRRDLFPEWGVAASALYWLLAGLLALPAIDNGQANLHLLAAVLLGYSCVARRSWWPAAGWLTLAVWLKLYPVAALGLAALGAPRHMLPRAVVCLAVAFGGVFLLQRPDYVSGRYRDFAAASAADDRADLPLKRAPKDWTILPRVAVGQVIPRRTAAAVSVAAGLTFAVGVAFGEASLPFILVASLVWMTLFGPATEPNTYSLLAPVAGPLCVAVRARWRVLPVAGTFLLVASIAACAFPGGAELLDYGPQPAAAVCFLVSLGGWRPQCQLKSSVPAAEQLLLSAPLGQPPGDRTDAGDDS
jgi:hypothetical protein